ncbi:MAG: LysM peptidoglycan-binding domain-containing protein, partial [Caldilineaceae bacterium]
MQKKVPIVSIALAARRRWGVPVVLIFAILITLLPTAALAAPAEAPLYNDGVYYWVQRGDTLSEIAKWHGVTVHALMYANGIKNPNHIYVGQKLYIPDGYGHGKPGGGPVGGPQCAYYHTVQYKQTLGAIANYYGVNIYTLAQVNAIYNWNHIYVGQRLCIPGGYQPPAPPPYKPPPPKPYPPHPQPQPPQPSTCTYTVQAGDTLAKIAFWYGTTVQALVQLNNLYHVNQLYVGQVLYVPSQNCPGPKPPDPAPPTSDSWTGEYFSNKYLQGPAAFTRQDGSINFDWGGDGPGGGVSNDQFSVIWTRTAYFQAGTYRFYATVDDGIRVYVDGHLIIDSWREQPATSYFGDIYLGEGNHSLRV